MNINGIRRQLAALRRDLPEADEFSSLSDQDLDAEIERLRDELLAMGEDPDEGDGGLYELIKPHMTRSYSDE